MVRVPSAPYALALFARPPEPGRVKTRLARVVGPAFAAALSAAFLADVLERCLDVAGASTTLYVAGDPNHSALDAIVEAVNGAPPLRRAQAPSPELGIRMRVALEEGIAEAGACVLIGSDLPTLPRRVLADAARILATAEADVVLGPSADGGFYLVGARGRVPALFEGVRYGTRHALTDTLALARRDARLRVALLPPWYDVDTARDLRLVSAHLALSPASAPRTAQLLADARPDHRETTRQRPARGHGVSVDVPSDQG